jgi:hypothetical protein
MLTNNCNEVFNEFQFRNSAGDSDLYKPDDCPTRQTCCETGTQSRESFVALSFIRPTLEPRKTVWLPKRSEKADLFIRRSAETKHDLALVVTYHASILRPSLLLTIKLGCRLHGAHYSWNLEQPSGGFYSTDRLVRQKFQHCVARR